MKVLLYSDDINLLSYWEKVLKKEYIVFDDIDELKNSKKNIIIINYSAFNSKEKEILSLLKNSLNLVLVLHRNPTIDTAKKMLAYGAKGYGNALMKEHFLHSAIDTMREGMIWLYPELTSELITQIPTKPNNDISTYLNLLSQREKEVALLIKDGDTYKAVGGKLSITPRTVKAHTQSIYKKLEVKDRIALALLLK